MTFNNQPLSEIKESWWAVYVSGEKILDTRDKY